LELIIHEQKIDLIAITETWLEDTMIDSELNIAGYTIFRKDRKQVRDSKGGGVLLYVRDCFNAYYATELNGYQNESLWIRLQMSQTRCMLIGVCYKSPTAKDEEVKSMYEAIEKASSCQSMILGDFNCPSIDWSTLHCDSSDQPFVDLTQNCFLHQHVHKPTRGNNILDLVLTTEPAMIEELQVLEPLATGDHSKVMFQLIIETESNEQKVDRWMFKRADFDEINQFLSLQDWDHLFKNKNVDDKWMELKMILQKVIEKYVPKSANKRKQEKCPWINYKVKKTIKSRNRLWKKYSNTKDYGYYLKYVEMRNNVVKEIRKAKNIFEKKLVNSIKQNPKSFYSYVRSRAKTKDKVGPLKDQNGKLVLDDKDRAQLLNTFFSSVFTEENMTQIPEVKNRDDTGGDDEKLNEIKIDSIMVFNKLARLKEGKAPGDDGFVPLFLKQVASEICYPLAEIFNSSLKEGVVPLDWRIANVTPIYKKGSRQEPGNYRPISLTSQIGKLLESIIRDEIVIHLRERKLIGDTQHGFTQKRSCLTNLLEFMEIITQYVDDGHPVDVIYLDFQKAFDKVPHARLIKKVKAHGINGKILTWIEAWLSGRLQRVVLNGSKSDWTEVMSGVPQGSVLGPLLFVIFINDIDDNIVNEILKFADDTKLLGAVSTKEEVDELRKDLHKLFCWSQEWQMLFNVAKCGVVHIGHNNPKENYTLGGIQIDTLHEERDLGVIIDESLKCRKQCAKAVNAANATLGMIKRSFVNREKQTILSLYKSVVRPKLEYCIQAWRPHLAKDIELIERVQHRATKLISSLRKETYETRVKLLGLTTLETRRLRGDLIEAFKIMKGFEDVSWNKFFTMSSSKQLRGHSLKLYKPSFRLDIRKYSFSQRVINEWNLLPDELLECKTVNNFKKYLDLHLRNNRGFK
jgi:hypothetical protein